MAWKLPASSGALIEQFLVTSDELPNRPIWRLSGEPNALWSGGA